MGHRLESQVDIEIRPVQVIRTRQLDATNLSNRGLLEPREVLEWHEQFLFADEEPKPMG